MRIANAGATALVLGLVGGSALVGMPGRAYAESVGPVLSMPGMNVFRRYAADDPEPLFAFYADVLGHQRLTAFNVGGPAPVTTFQAGAGPSQLKFTAENDELYELGGMENATGMRLWTFYYSDRAALTERFVEHGLKAPAFEPVGDSGQLSAVVTDPEGELVQLIVTGDPPGTTYAEIEIGLTVADLDASRAYYREFVGLEELEPVYDPVFETMKYPYRHGSTTIALRHFGADLPADTGTGGIQYVVSDVERVARIAAQRGIDVKQPLSELQGFALRTIWLGDPDGITNYFAQTGRQAPAQ